MGINAILHVILSAIGQFIKQMSEDRRVRGRARREAERNERDKIKGEADDEQDKIDEIWNDPDRGRSSGRMRDGTF